MIRDYQPGDANALALVYRNAVITMGPQFYSNREVCAWALYPYDIAEFRTRLSRGRTLVFEDQGRAVAFAQLEPLDHVAFLYCLGSHSRRGIATLLHKAMETHARAAGAIALTTDASRVSRPLFARLGYELVGVENVERRGVSLERFKMRKTLGKSSN